LAAERVQAFLDEFKEYLPPEDLEETIQKMKKWLEILMKIKCDLLVADLQCKLVFIPRELRSTQTRCMRKMAKAPT
jgi:hypothetical protein